MANQEDSAARSTSGWLWPLGIVFLVAAVLVGVVLPLFTSAWMTAFMLVLALAVVFAVTAIVGVILGRRNS